MQHTTNYNLKMPESTDPVQISDLSENFSSIDALIKAATESGMRIAAGNYRGTGTYGTNNRTTLTFDFPIKLLIVASSTGDYPNYIPSIAIFANDRYFTDDTTYVLSFHESGRTSTIKAFWGNPDSTTISWYANSAAAQLNNGNLARYVAIG